MVKILATILGLIIICSNLCCAEYIDFNPNNSYYVEVNPGETYTMNCIADREQELWEIDILGVRKQTFDDYIVTLGFLGLAIWGVSEGGKHDSLYGFATGIGFSCAFFYRIGF